MLNGVALLAISQHPRFGAGARGIGRYAGLLIGSGAAVFSGSIFLLLLDRPRSALTVSDRFGRVLMVSYADSAFWDQSRVSMDLFELHCIGSKVLMETG